MKTYLLLFCCLCSVGLAFAQNQASDFTGNKSDQARNPRNDLMNFVPNEVLVKFKDAVPMAVGARLKAAGISSIDKVLAAHGITSLEKLFPAEQKPLKVRMMKSPQGKDMKIPALDKIYKISVPPSTATATAPINIFQLIEELKAQPEVEYAEPNYIYSIDNMQPVGPVLTAEDVAKLQMNNPNKAKESFTPNDPLYSQQGYIQTVKADQVWQQTTGDTTQVIAILDTGVDWNHPDLKNKIWTNPNPATSWNMEGVMDDIRGWDFINNDNNPMDDNSHGTHVAGIAAAETNNGIGIAGVCPKAKIMPIKVFTSKGVADVATIVKGINYAATHGATVINMSFGISARSLTMENALSNAYTSAILVAAAGNSGLCIGPGTCNGYAGNVFYPAGLPYVLGVQANDSYSNYDQDGSVYSGYEEGFNYELTAPGTAISTTPFGNYRILSGTSMSCPIVSGIAALYKSKHPGNTTEMLWGDFIHSSTGLIDSYNALFPPSKYPILDVMGYSITDTTKLGDGDGQADAGETIQLWVKARNTWGSADSVFVILRNSKYADEGDITILQNTAYLGSLSPYAAKNNNLNPLSFVISPTIRNEKSVPLDIILKNGKNGQEYVQSIDIKVYNGNELSGLISKDTLLTANKSWLINSNLRIATGVKMTLQAGTHLQVNAGLDNRGYIQAIGDSINRIIIEGSLSGNFILGYVDMDLRKNTVQCNAKHCNFVNGKGAVGNFEYCKFTDFLPNYGNEGGPVFNGSYYNCLFKNLDAGDINGNNIQSVFDNVYITRNYYSNFQSKFSVYNILNSIKRIIPWNTNNWKNYKSPLFYITSNDQVNQIYKNSFINNDEYSYFVSTSGNNDAVNLPFQYWGTTDSLKIIKKYTDFWSSADKPFFFYKPILNIPSDSCHAHVWKVLVNGKDAQDELVDPIGVGKQRFDVYFNRSMNKDSIPQVSFGVRSPFNQQAVNENGGWSNDGKIYKVYKTIKLTTGDGINRIRVAGAKEKNGWNWEIPVEDSRFSFIISAANSASADFMSTAGLGKVKLEWNNNDLADGLGYNMYRMEHINDSTLTEAVMINPTLITDTLYTDFAVTPNKKYYYYYKVMRTNMSETDPSKVVSATPFTASKGDANGDLSVNVLDITTIVAYLLNNNPQPFIFEAADVNSDNTINVLDIVGVVNKVLYGSQKVKGISLDQQANLYLQNDTLFADVNVPVGGIQFDMSGVSSIEDIQVLQTLQGFESGYSATETGLRLLYYSISGKSVPAGTHIPLLVLKKGSKITDAIFGGTNGSPIRVNFLMTRIPDISNNMNQTVAELGQNFPNPLNGQTTIPIRVYEPVDEVVVRVVNMMGQEVEIIRMANPYIGEHLLSWNPGTNKGLFVYTLEIRNGNQKQICPNKKMIVQ